MFFSLVLSFIWNRNSVPIPHVRGYVVMKEHTESNTNSRDIKWEVESLSQNLEWKPLGMEVFQTWLLVMHISFCFSYAFFFFRDVSSCTFLSTLTKNGLLPFLTCVNSLSHSFLFLVTLISCETGTFFQQLTVCISTLKIRVWLAPSVFYSLLICCFRVSPTLRSINCRGHVTWYKK